MPSIELLPEYPLAETTSANLRALREMVRIEMDQHCATIKNSTSLFKRHSAYKHLEALGNERRKLERWIPDSPEQGDFRRLLQTLKRPFWRRDASWWGGGTYGEGIHDVR